MPKHVKVPLKPIVRQIKHAAEKLSKAANEAITPAEKKKLKGKAQKLEALIADVQVLCPKGKKGYTVLAVVK
jgi:Family of unknown function (DUF6381)